MFYEPKDGHGLPHNPFLAIVAPRPIGWISTIGPDGAANLSPYSAFISLSSKPPMVAYCSEGEKDNLLNLREIGEFVVNVATRPLATQMNLTSKPIPRGEDEFELAGLARAPSRLIRPPRVAESPAALECKVTEIVTLKTLEGEELDRWIVIGAVVGVHIDDRFINGEGRFDLIAAQTICRLGYLDYAEITESFVMTRPWYGQT